MSEKKYILTTQLIIDLNEYEKQSPMCQYCKKKFSECNPKCDSFYFVKRQNKRA